MPGAAQQGLVAREGKDPRTRLAILRQRGQGADFDEGEAEVGEEIGIFTGTIEAGCDAALSLSENVSFAFIKTFKKSACSNFV